MDTVTNVGDPPPHWGNYRAIRYRIKAWVIDRFGLASFTTLQERADRLLEEAMELHQHAYEANPYAGQMMVDGIKARVWSRPVGDLDKELAGVVLCAMAYGESAAIDIPKAVNAEMTRIEGVPRHITEAKHQAKVDAGLGLPLPKS